ncbi:MAG: polymorphic toxin-type HINT domain-containing protein, partial [Phycicoccus sp.]
IRRDPNGRKTLYLGDTEVTYTPAQGATPASTSAVRVFTFEGQVVALRTGSGPGGIVFQPPGYQGTALSQGDGAGGRYTVRRFDPFGNTRTPSADWVGERGFLGGTGATTASTGLVHLGAREYDPATGRFTSVDPVMDLSDPTQWNAYSYAQNSPITLSDPDGNRPLGAGDTGCSNCKSTYNKKTKKSGWKFGNEKHGSRSVYGKKYQGRKYTGGSNYQPIKRRPKPSTRPSSGGGGRRAAPHPDTALRWCASQGCQYNQPGAVSPIGWLPEVPYNAVEGSASDIGHLLLDGVGLVPLFGEFADAINAVWYMVEGDYVSAGLSVAATVPIVGSGATAAKLGIKGAAKTGAKACSFAGATVVLMADGSKKSIDQVKVGDKVLATDPETGEQAAKTVEHVFVHGDTVTDLAIDGQVISTTDDHPFWSVTDQRFERADELAPGEKVLVAYGRAVTVSGLRLGTDRSALAYNLSVEDIHTYHVGAHAILVHNECSILGRRIAQHSLDEGHKIPGLDTPESLGQYVDDITSIPGTTATRGRTVWWDGDRGLITIRQGDAGTVFKPDRGYQYFRDQIDE